MKLRTATKEDAFGIAEVHVASWRYAFKGIMSQDILDNQSVPERAASWTKILVEDSGRVFVSEHGGYVSGFVHTCGYRYDDIATPIPGEIASIYLSPEVIGQGVGAGLLKRGISFLESEGFSDIALWALEANISAIKFYNRFGFYSDGATKIHKKSGLAEQRYIRRGNAT